MLTFQKGMEGVFLGVPSFAGAGLPPDSRQQQPFLSETSRSPGQLEVRAISGLNHVCSFHFHFIRAMAAKCPSPPPTSLQVGIPSSPLGSPAQLPLGSLSVTEELTPSKPVILPLAPASPLPHTHIHTHTTASKSVNNIY